MAKTDWALNDKVQPADLNTIGQEINQNKETVDTHLLDNSKQVPHLGTTTNVGDAYSITTTETINANQKFTIKFNAASATTPTLKINTGTAHPIKKANGNAAKLYASVYTLFWDGTNFILLGEGGEYGNATAAQVLAPNTIGTENGIVTGTMPNQGSKSVTLTSQGQQYAIPAGFHDGTGKVTTSFANLVAGNIKNGVNIGGVVGSLEPRGYYEVDGPATLKRGERFTVNLPFIPSIVTVSCRSHADANFGSAYLGCIAKFPPNLKPGYLIWVNNLPGYAFALPGGTDNITRDTPEIPQTFDVYMSSSAYDSENYSYKIKAWV